MVNTALTVNLCSTITNEARKLTDLAIINCFFFGDTYMINKLNV